MKAIRTDLASFTGAGHGSVRIPSGVGLEPGETVYLVDDDSDSVEADILSVAGDTVQVLVRWERYPVPVFDLELSPMARQAGVTYLHDVYLDADAQVATGDRVLVRDEGGAFWVAEVGEREVVRFGGHRFALRIEPLMTV